MICLRRWLYQLLNFYSTQVNALSDKILPTAILIYNKLIHLFQSILHFCWHYPKLKTGCICFILFSMDNLIRFDTDINNIRQYNISYLVVFWKLWLLLLFQHFFGCKKQNSVPKHQIQDSEKCFFMRTFCHKVVTELVTLKLQINKIGSLQFSIYIFGHKLFFVLLDTVLDLVFFCFFFVLLVVYNRPLWRLFNMISQ